MNDQDIIPDNLPQPNEEKPGIKKRRGNFSPEEDQLLSQLVLLNGEKSWKKIATLIKTKSARQCRDRWKNYLNPELVQDDFTPEEDQLLLKKFEEYGSQWQKILHFFPKRSLNNVRNRYKRLSRKFGKFCTTPPKVSSSNMFEPIFSITESEFNQLLLGSSIDFC